MEQGEANEARPKPRSLSYHMFLGSLSYITLFPVVHLSVQTRMDTQESLHESPELISIYVGSDISAYGTPVSLRPKVCDQDCAGGNLFHAFDPVTTTARFCIMSVDGWRIGLVPLRVTIEKRGLYHVPATVAC